MPLPIYQLPTRWKPVQRFPVNCWVELDWSGLMQIFLSLSKPPNLFIIVCGTPADGLYRLNPTFLFWFEHTIRFKKRNTGRKNYFAGNYELSYLLKSGWTFYVKISLNYIECQFEWKVDLRMKMTSAEK